MAKKDSAATAQKAPRKPKALIGDPYVTSNQFHEWGFDYVSALDAWKKGVVVEMPSGAQYLTDCQFNTYKKSSTAGLQIGEPSVLHFFQGEGGQNCMFRINQEPRSPNIYPVAKLRFEEDRLIATLADEVEIEGLKPFKG